MSRLAPLLALCLISLAACVPVAGPPAQERPSGLSAMISAEILHYPEEVEQFYAANGGGLV